MGRFRGIIRPLASIGVQIGRFSWAFDRRRTCSGAFLDFDRRMSCQWVLENSQAAGGGETCLPGPDSPRACARCEGHNALSSTAQGGAGAPRGARTAQPRLRNALRAVCQAPWSIQSRPSGRAARRSFMRATPTVNLFGRLLGRLMDCEFGLQRTHVRQSVSQEDPRHFPKSASKANTHIS
jgi:hypothetical protein